MNEHTDPAPQAPLSRRQFLKRTSLATATTVAAVNAPAILHAQAKQPMNAVIIGMGGRGTGAGSDFLNGAKSVGAEAKILAVADMFTEKLAAGQKNFGVPENKCFAGPDAYMKALEVPGVNYAIIATPPGFKPGQFKAAVEAGKHVFVEKPVAVDGPGARIMYAAGEVAKQRGLKIAAGTQRRHRPSYIQTVKRLQDGAIGEIIALRAYWVNGGPIWHRGDRGATDMERQVRNWYHYIWLCGDHICEQHVHNIDICNWIMNGHPVKCWGQGSRQQLGDKSGEIWDNFDVEFEYANGVRMFSYCGQIKRSWASVSEHVHGATGTADLYDGRNLVRPKNGAVWRPTVRREEDNGYMNEHAALISAILGDKEMNETKNVTDSTLTAIMGREASYSGAAVEWDNMLKSEFKYGPEAVYTNPSALEMGAFRTLKPPMPSVHDIFKGTTSLPTV